VQEEDDYAARTMAYHEAGHAFMSVRLGFVLDAVILRELSPGEWIGETADSSSRIRPGMASPDEHGSVAMVALAGAHARRKPDPADAETEQTWSVYEEHDRRRAANHLGCAEGGGLYADTDREVHELIEQPNNWRAIRAVAKALLSEVTDTEAPFPRAFTLSGLAAIAAMDLVAQR
jgi:hypothetical protein